MQKAINRLHRQILAGVNQGGGALGALVIVGSASTPDHGTVTSFSGGNTAPIVCGLVKEMRRDPGCCGRFHKHGFSRQYIQHGSV